MPKYRWGRGCLRGRIASEEGATRRSAPRHLTPPAHLEGDAADRCSEIDEKDPRPARPEVAGALGPGGSEANGLGATPSREKEADGAMPWELEPPGPRRNLAARHRWSGPDAGRKLGIPPSWGPLPDRRPDCGALKPRSLRRGERTGEVELRRHRGAMWSPRPHMGPRP
ncbi:hypothetical protein NDU88_003230 [Pleurodeles waltl]|uniref:Uncharacterized protein n=1 Tax=Pleurodeles waltl TaxID=8319 RepID=A0AAV7KUY9_PLEWA|nr:hypothetical protein NDU88_003230 [Pleurodeles waltl]